MSEEIYLMLKLIYILTPNTTDTQINYYYVARIEDAGAYTNHS